MSGPPRSPFTAEEQVRGGHASQRVMTAKGTRHRLSKRDRARGQSAGGQATAAKGPEHYRALVRIREEKRRAREAGEA